MSRGLRKPRLFRVVAALGVLGGIILRSPDAGAAPPPAAFTLPGTRATLQVGGFARLDAIHDFNPIEDPRQFDPSKIPTSGATGQATLFQVTASRLSLDLRTPSFVENGRVFFEIDFFTSSGAPRIRHAFFDAWRFRVGQDWTTFTLDAPRPTTLDLESPIAIVTQRSPLVRYTQPLGRELELAVAAEYLPAKADPSVGARSPGRVVTSAPDGVARLRFHRPGVEVSLHGLVRELHYTPDDGAESSLLGAGANFSASVTPVPWLTLFGQAIGGSGIASYRGGVDLEILADGTLAAAPVAGGTLGLTVRWLPGLALRSNALVSVARRLDGDDEAVPSPNRRLTYAAINLVGRPHELLELGAEYLFGTRRTADDAMGYAHRVQVTAMALIP